VTRLDPAIRRTQIIEAVATLLDSRDPVDVRFDEIADAAGVSRALVYNYFGDREGLLAAVYVHHFEAARRFVAESVDRTQPASHRVRATVEAYLTFASEHPGAWRLLHLVQAHEHETVIAAREKLFSGMARRWSGTPEARLAAIATVGAMEAATIEWLRDPTAISLERLTQLLEALLWRGLASLGEYGVRSDPVPIEVPTAT
jgi:AcrR family transcriptional regulator